MEQVSSVESSLCTDRLGDLQQIVFSRHVLRVF